MSVEGSERLYMDSSKRSSTTAGAKLLGRWITGGLPSLPPPIEKLSTEDVLMGEKGLMPLPFMGVSSPTAGGGERSMVGGEPAGPTDFGKGLVLGLPQPMLFGGGLSESMLAIDCIDKSPMGFTSSKLAPSTELLNAPPMPVTGVTETLVFNFGEGAFGALSGPPTRTEAASAGISELASEIELQNTPSPTPRDGAGEALGGALGGAGGGGEAAGLLLGGPGGLLFGAAFVVPSLLLLVSPKRRPAGACMDTDWISSMSRESPDILRFLDTSAAAVGNEGLGAEEPLPNSMNASPAALAMPEGPFGAGGCPAELNGGGAGGEGPRAGGAAELELAGCVTTGGGAGGAELPLGAAGPGGGTCPTGGVLELPHGAEGPLGTDGAEGAECPCAADGADGAAEPIGPDGAVAGGGIGGADAGAPTGAAGGRVCIVGAFGGGAVLELLCPLAAGRVCVGTACAAGAMLELLGS